MAMEPKIHSGQGFWDGLGRCWRGGCVGRSWSDCVGLVCGRVGEER